MSCLESSPRLSVIMGVYNIATLRCFHQAVESVLAQTMSDFEFIICDDGSTDETWQALVHYAQGDQRIRLLHSQNNEGLASALNHCISASRAPLLARQDADDLSVTDRFQQQILFLNRHPEIDFVGSQIVLYDESGLWGRRKFPLYPQNKDFLFSMPYTHGALMFRKESLQRVGSYRVAKETRRAEDYDLLMRMYANGMRGANLPDELYWFLEDKAAHQRRKYRYRLDEVKVRYLGFRALRLGPLALPFVLKPLVVGLIPSSVLRYLKCATGHLESIQR